MAPKFKFYDIRRLLKDYPESYYYVVFGERSNGKTYSALDYALERYHKNGDSPTCADGARTFARRIWSIFSAGTLKMDGLVKSSITSGIKSTMARPDSIWSAQTAREISNEPTILAGLRLT